MKQYEEKLRRQMLGTAVAAAAMALVVFLGIAAEAGLIPLNPMAGDSRYASMWRGFLTGAGIGVLALMAVWLGKSLRALRSPEALKRMYVKEHDERTQKIWTSARATASQVFLLTGMVAGTAAGYFSPVIGATILLCTVGHALLCLGMKYYYGKKF